MTTMYVVPVAGRLVPDPELGTLLGEAGRAVSPTQYWMRRLEDGDVVVKPAPNVVADKRNKEA